MERLHGEEDESRHVAGVFLSLSHGGSSSSAAAAPTTPPAPDKLCRRGRAAVFECRTCGRQFATFQALGGHRSSHLRRPAAAKLRPKPAVVVHACATCGLGFSTGQALGGHMRRHRRPSFWMDDSDGDVVGFKQIVVHDRPSSASVQLLDLFV